MRVQLVSRGLFLMEQIQKQVVPLKTSKVYLSIDTKFVGVIIKDSKWKINSEMLWTVGIQWPRLSQQSSLT